MRRLLPQRADDAPKQPRYDIFFTLVSLCRYIGKSYAIVTQEKLLERLRESTGHRMSRRTLNRHLNGLERAALINRTSRHQRARSGKLRLRATMFTFGQRGILWIKRLQDASLISLGRLAVPKMAQSQKTPIYQESPAVDKSSTAGNGKSRPPRLRGGKRGPPNTPARRAGNGAARTQGTPLSRDEAQFAYHRGFSRR